MKDRSCVNCKYFNKCSLIVNDGCHEFFPNDKYDSKLDTQTHIIKVMSFVDDFEGELCLRSRFHDRSKLEDPEKAIFDVVTPRLKKLTYGTEEYKKSLAEMGPALQHHYENNRHHPEHHKNGINDMSLIDIVEMLMDWKAASERHVNGDIFRSIELNQERFNMSDQLKDILVNTAKAMRW